MSTGGQWFFFLLAVLTLFAWSVWPRGKRVTQRNVKRSVTPAPASNVVPFKKRPKGKLKKFGFYTANGYDGYYEHGGTRGVPSQYSTTPYKRLWW